MTIEKLDPAKYEVFYHKLDETLAEGMNTVRYLSASVITREAGEAQTAFYLPTGEAVDIAAGILMHFLNVTRVVHYMYENRYEADDIGIYERDQFINSEAYIGGMHIPDTSMIAPFIYKGELLGWVASISHTSEVGGIEPGGVCPSATEAWHDGVHLPAVKLIERGKIRRDVMGMILRSVRAPSQMELDLKARVAGNVKVIGRLEALVDEVGADFFKKASEQIVEDSAVYARAKIRQLRPGVYYGRSYCDSIGRGSDKIAVLQMEMEVSEEGELFLRMPIISPQQPSFNNCYEPAVEATAAYTLLTQLLWGGRWSSGLMEPIHLEITPSSRMKADSSSSVGYCTVGIAFSYCAALTEALSRAFYASDMEEEVQAPGAFAFNAPTISGLDQFGRPFGNYSMCTCLPVGGGGRIGKDGIDSNYHFYNPFQYVADAEGEEAIMPITHLRINHSRDAAGYGKWRSGVSAATIFMVHGSENVYLNSMGVGGKMPGNQGLFGGYAAPCCYADHILNSNIYELIKERGRLPLEIDDIKDLSSIVSGDYSRHSPAVPNKPVKPGDLIATLTTTGAGLGDPVERDPESVLSDIKENKTSLECAVKVYCVEIDPGTLEIDIVKTGKLREEKRKERLSKGIPAHEYIKKMAAKRKARDLTSPVLEFMDELMSFSDAFRNQLQWEESFVAKKVEALHDIKLGKHLYKLTPYVNVVEDVHGAKTTCCSKCEYVYCLAKENYKYHSLVYDRDPAEVYPEHLAGDKDWFVLREFYCPGCGAQIEVETVPPGMPILPSCAL